MVAFSVAMKYVHDMFHTKTKINMDMRIDFKVRIHNRTKQDNDHTTDHCNKGDMDMDDNADKVGYGTDSCSMLDHL